MNFTLYFILSVLLVLSMLYYAYYTHKQFYPVILFLVTSKICFLIIGNMILAFSLFVAKIFKTIFFGTLRDSEIELLVEKAKYTIPETCLALTIFRSELSPTVIVLFGSLILIKLFHRLTKFRLEYLEQIMPISFYSQCQVLSLLVTLIMMDLVLAINSYYYIQSHGKSVILLFGFEFGLLFIYSINLTCRFMIQMIDSKLENGLPTKGLYLMISELVSDIIRFVIYFCFFCLVFSQYGLPIHILRDVYISFLSCQKKLISFIQYIRLTNNFDSRFENATAEELIHAGNCLVCRESMDSGKKIPCGHVFHLECLRMWLQHQQTCPLCRYYTSYYYYYYCIR